MREPIDQMGENDFDPVGCLASSLFALTILLVTGVASYVFWQIVAL